MMKPCGGLSSVHGRPAFTRPLMSHSETESQGSLSGLQGWAEVRSLLSTQKETSPDSKFPGYDATTHPSTESLILKIKWLLSLPTLSVAVSVCQACLLSLWSWTLRVFFNCLVMLFKTQNLVPSFSLQEWDFSAP